METTALDAGPQLDALIAERVFGIDVLGLARCSFYTGAILGAEEPGKEHQDGPVVRPVYASACACESLQAEYPENTPLFGHSPWCLETTPAYSTDIAAAMSVVEALHAKGDCASLIYRAGNTEPFEKLTWFVEFRIAGAWAAHESLPLAICRAALLALAQENAPVA